MKNEIGRACSTCGGQEMCIQSLVGKRDGEKPFARSNRRWDAKIKMGLQDVQGGGGRDWIDLA
jgi:hypothetical protein